MRSSTSSAIGSRRGDRVEGRRRAEAVRIRVHPDAGDLLLLAHQDRLDRPAQARPRCRPAGRRAAAGIDDRAEQQQLGAREAVADLDLARRDVGHQQRLVGARSAAARAARAGSEGSRAPHRYSIEKISSGRQARPSSHAERDEQDDDRQRQAQQVGLDPRASGARHIARRSRRRRAAGRRARCRPTRVVSAWTMVVAALTARIIDEAGADHDPRRHAEQIDHRRHQDEAAADAEQARSGCRRRSRARAARPARCRGPSCRSASAAEARRPSGCGAAARLRRGCAPT